MVICPPSSVRNPPVTTLIEPSLLEGCIFFSVILQSISEKKVHNSFLGVGKVGSQPFLGLRELTLQAF